MNTTIELDGDEYEVAVSFDTGHVYSAAIVGLRVDLYDIETRRRTRHTIPHRAGEPVIVSTELREALECDFAMACAEAA